VADREEWGDTDDDDDDDDDVDLCFLHFHTAASSYCFLSVIVSNKCIAVRNVATLLRELACHMGSHSVTCHLAEVTFPSLPQWKLELD